MLVAMFWPTILLYFAGWVLAAVRFWRPNAFLERWGTGGLAVAWLMHSAMLALGMAAEGFSRANMLSLMAWAITGVYFTMLLRGKSSAKGQPQPVLAYVFPPVTVALLVSTWITRETMLGHTGLEALPLGPDGGKILLVAHVGAVITAHVLFALGCAVSIIYLWSQYRLRNKALLASGPLPSLGSLERYNHNLVAAGVFFLTLGIILGIGVAGLSTLPGRIFSLRLGLHALAWLLYAIFLVEYALERRRGQVIAIWSIVGFGVVTVALINELTILTSR